nr:unnamed protein product [Callosobruchus chinensis]
MWRKRRRLGRRRPSRVFDELRERCSSSANNPQTKRKLEDVARNWKAYTIFYESKSCLRKHWLPFTKWFN